MLRLHSATEPKGNFIFPFFLSTSAPLHCAWLVSLPNHSEQKKATIHSALRLHSGTRYCVETVRAPSNTCKFSVETRLIASLQKNIETSISHTDGARSVSTNRQEIHRHNIGASLKQKNPLALLTDFFHFLHQFYLKTARTGKPAKRELPSEITPPEVKTHHA